jgi:hypothetical protein
MDLCPHCGEPLEEDATACPHCGSDYETGWNPEAEYYSVELPELDEEDESPEEAPRAGGPVRSRLTASKISGHGHHIGGGIVLVTAFLFFVAASYSAYSWWFFLPSTVLFACTIYLRLSTSGRAL